MGLECVWDAVSDIDVAETESAGTRDVPPSSTVSTPSGCRTDGTAAPGVAVSSTDWWTRSPAETSTGNGFESGVLYVLNEASVQFRWSSVSKTSPWKSSLNRVPSRSHPMEETSMKGWCGLMSTGKNDGVLAPPGLAMVTARPASSGRCSTTSPIRLLRKAAGAAPSNVTLRLSFMR
jgi:hypothetical protein